MSESLPIGFTWPLGASRKTWQSLRPASVREAAHS
jgi:hypothetical protein